MRARVPAEEAELFLAELLLRARRASRRREFLRVRFELRVGRNSASHLS